MKTISILGFGVIWLVIGCGSEKATEGDPQAYLDAQKAAGPLGVGVPVVQLVQPGAGPGVPLRYHFVPGDLGDLVVDVNLSTPGTPGEGIPEMVMPTMRYVLSLRGETIADGNYRVHFKVSSVDVLGREGSIPLLIDHLRRPMEELGRPFAGFVVIDDRGLAQEVNAPIPPGAREELKQAFDLLIAHVHQLVPPLPAEGVGMGASWTATRALRTFEISLNEQVTYSLTGLTDQGGTLAASVRRTAGPQPWTAPSKTPQRVVAYSYMGVGGCNFSFRSPLSGNSMSVQSSRTLTSAAGSPGDIKMNVQFVTGPKR